MIQHCVGTSIKVTRAGMPSHSTKVNHKLYNRMPVLLPLVSFSAHMFNADIACRFSLELNMAPTRVLV